MAFSQFRIQKGSHKPVKFHHFHNDSQCIFISIGIVSEITILQQKAMSASVNVSQYVTEDNSNLRARGFPHNGQYPLFITINKKIVRDQSLDILRLLKQVQGVTQCQSTYFAIPWHAQFLQGSGSRLYERLQPEILQSCCQSEQTNNMTQHKASSCVVPSEKGFWVILLRRHNESAFPEGWKFLSAFCFRGIITLSTTGQIPGTSMQYQKCDAGSSKLCFSFLLLFPDCLYLFSISFSCIMSCSSVGPLIISSLKYGITLVSYSSSVSINCWKTGDIQEGHS